MSIDFATALRGEAGKARQVAERVSNPDNKDVLAQLVKIAERLERDARDIGAGRALRLRLWGRKAFGSSADDYQMLIEDYDGGL